MDKAVKERKGEGEAGEGEKERRGEGEGEGRERAGERGPLEPLGFVNPDSSGSLTRAAVDVSVVIASSSRLLHSVVATTFLDVFLANVDVSCALVVTVVHSGRGRTDVMQLWDDQQWLRQIC